MPYKDKIKAREYSAKWSQRHPDKEKEKQARYRNGHKAQIRELKKIHAIWRKENPQQYQKDYYQAHKKEIQQRSKEYYHRNKGKIAVRQAARYALTRTERLMRDKENRQKLRDNVFAHYGGYCCACCGETTPEFLSIDHVNGRGNQHRRQVGSGGTFYNWLRRNNFPPGFRVLCFNCNCAMGFFGQCPHQKLGNANPNLEPGPGSRRVALIGNGQLELF